MTSPKVPHTTRPPVTRGPSVPKISRAGRLSALLLCVGLLAGCATRYDITLNSGSRITNVSRPVMDESGHNYRFKDASGETQVLPAMRVRTIEPASKRPGPGYLSY